jgi:hypothetical protein
MKPENETKIAPKKPDLKVETIDDTDPPIGPTTGKLLPEWRKDRDYVYFNPTPEK